jgi:hypothetical protein
MKPFQGVNECNGDFSPTKFALHCGGLRSCDSSLKPACGTHPRLRMVSSDVEAIYWGSGAGTSDFTSVLW